MASFDHQKLGWTSESIQVNARLVAARQKQEAIHTFLSIRGHDSKKVAGEKSQKAIRIAQLSRYNRNQKIKDFTKIT